MHQCASSSRRATVQGANIADALTAAGRDHDAAAIRSCRDIWTIDAYPDHHITRLVRVNLCHNRYCPWCAAQRAANISSALRTAYTALLPRGYTWYHITITIPSAPVLAPMLAELRRLWDALYKCCADDRNISRPIPLIGAARSIEITRNTTGWHAHMHILAVCPHPIIDADVPRTRCYNREMHTPAELRLGVWLRDHHRPTAPLRRAYPHYECRINPICDGGDGIQQIAGYACKLSDISSMRPSHLRELADALDGVRCIQTRGCIYHLSALADSVDPWQSLDAIAPADVAAVRALIAAMAVERAHREVGPIDALAAVYHDCVMLSMSRHKIASITQLLIDAGPPALLSYGSDISSTASAIIMRDLPQIRDMMAAIVDAFAWH